MNRRLFILGGLATAAAAVVPAVASKPSTITLSQLRAAAEDAKRHARKKIYWTVMDNPNSWAMESVERKWVRVTGINESGSVETELLTLNHSPD